MITFLLVFCCWLLIHVIYLKKKLFANFWVSVQNDNYSDSKWQPRLDFCFSQPLTLKSSLKSHEMASFFIQIEEGVNKRRFFLEDLEQKSFQRSFFWWQPESKRLRAREKKTEKSVPSAILGFYESFLLNKPLYFSQLKINHVPQVPTAKN